MLLLWYNLQKEMIKLTDDKAIIGCTFDELQEILGDPTGLLRYLEAKDAENDRRYTETMRMNRLILAVSTISMLTSIAALLR